MPKMRSIYLNGGRHACFEGAGSAASEFPIDPNQIRRHEEGPLGRKTAEFVRHIGVLHNPCASCIITARIFATRRNG